MAKLREQIRYAYSETPNGGTILISSDNREALQAIHAFLRFQISDHRTGDVTDAPELPGPFTFLPPSANFSCLSPSSPRSR